MKPYIVRPLGWSRAALLDRDRRNPVGRLISLYAGWDARCDHCPWGNLRNLRAGAAEALWRHYLDEHKEQK